MFILWNLLIYSILCFGDSLTWGFDPENFVRMDENKRWTGVLQELLGENYKVIEEGQNGRTIATDDSSEGEKNGIKYVIPCIESHKPLELMIIMLGTNDLKQKFSYSASNVAGEMGVFLEKVQAYNRFHLDDKMQILLVSPPAIKKPADDAWTNDLYDFNDAVNKSEKLPAFYNELADKFGCYFLDASKTVNVCPLDGIHLDSENQAKLGKAIYDKIIEDNIIKL